MIAFVQEHARLFPGRLQSAECTGFSGLPVISRCPPSVIDELLGALPSLIKPRSIVDTNWKRVALKIKSTDLSSVVKIVLTNNDEGAAAALYRNDPTFLSRCLSLNTLDIQSFGAGSFRWAAEAKHALDWRTANCHVPQVLDIVSMTGPPPLSLAPLESVRISTDTLFKDEMNDIALAFGKTLISMCFLSTSYETPFDTATFSFGSGWILPQLKYLVLLMPQLRLLADPGFYSQAIGPNLKTMKILDKYGGWFEIQDLYICHPFAQSMPELTYIWLEGGSGLTFHPDSFHQTPNLETLHIRMCSHEPQVYIPPEAELAESVLYRHTSIQNISYDGDHGLPQQYLDPSRRRPLWTWDWYLPNLNLLHLDGTIAFLFQFRMLAGCPALRHLALNIGTHKRVLLLQDFIVPASFSSSSGNVDNSLKSANRTEASNGCEELMVASSLHHLAFYGSWSLDEALRAEVFPRTFPNVKIFKDYFTKGCSVRDWIRTVRTWPRLREASLSLMQNELLNSISTLRECGLVRRKSSRRDGRNPRTHGSSSKETIWPRPLFYFNGGAWEDRQESISTTVLAPTPTIVDE